MPNVTALPQRVHAALVIEAVAHHYVYHFFIDADHAYLSVGLSTSVPTLSSCHLR